MRLPRNQLLLLFAGIFCTLKVNAGTFHTIATGTWSSSFTWLNGQVPPLSGSDTIYVHHHVMFTYPIALTVSTKLIIDTAGRLCGHERFHILSGSNLVNNGDFYADTLIINGGTLLNNGFIQLTNMAVITNGGSMANNGMMQIGTPFLCAEKPNSIEESSRANYSAYPNPAFAGQEIYIDNLPANCELLITDAQGKIIRKVNPGGVIQTNGLSPGIYFIEGRGSDILFHRKIIIAD